MTGRPSEYRIRCRHRAQPGPSVITSAISIMDADGRASATAAGEVVIKPT